MKQKVSPIHRTYRNLRKHVQNATNGSTSERRQKTTMYMRVAIQPSIRMLVFPICKGKKYDGINNFTARFSKSLPKLTPHLSRRRAEMQTVHPMLRLLRRTGVATSHDPMRRLSFASRPLPSFVASAPPCWSTPALARRVSPLMAPPNPAARRVSRFPHGSRSMAITSGVKVDEPGKPDRQMLTSSSTNDHSAISQGMENVETRGTTLEVMDGIAVKHDASGKILDISGREEDARIAIKDRDVIPIELEILPRSRHRDGSVYRATHSWKKYYHVADRNETRLTDPTDCWIYNGTCRRHIPTRLLQIFSLKLAELYGDFGSNELYGYIAVRDHMDPLLNYVVNISRDDPIIVEQGSLINIAGPKRGIDLYGTALVEYDMRFKTGTEESDDLQLIDGISAISDLWGIWNRAFTKRIHGDCGSVDITIARIHDAVQGTVEVVILEVQRSFNLCLGCFIGGYDDEEIRLFDGAIHDSRSLKRSVVAAEDGSTMALKLKVASKSSNAAEHCCSFKADTHGLATQKIKTDFGLISLKVTWSTLLSR